MKGSDQLEQACEPPFNVVRFHHTPKTFFSKKKHRISDTVFSCKREKLLQVYLSACLLDALLQGFGFVLLHAGLDH